MSDMLSVHDITWTLPPLPRAEAVDLLTLDHEELVAYSLDLQLDAESLRATLHAACTALAQQVTTNTRQRDTIARLIDANRALRAQLTVTA